MASLPLNNNRPLNNPITLLQNPLPQPVAPLGPTPDEVILAVTGSPSTTSHSSCQAPHAPVLTTRDSSNLTTFEALQLAADQGNRLALRQIGVMYRDGKSLPYNQEKAMRCFWKANKPSIVNLSCLRITDDMVEHLPDLFEEFGGYGQTRMHPPITRLDLSFNPITDIGAPFIAHILKHSQTLTELDLENTNFTGQGVEPIYAALKYFNLSVVYGNFEYADPMIAYRLGEPIRQNRAIKKIIDGLDTNYPTSIPKPFDILPMDVFRQLLQTIAEVHIKNPASRKQFIHTETRSTDVSKPATTKQLMDEVYTVLMSDLASASHMEG